MAVEVEKMIMNNINNASISNCLKSTDSTLSYLVRIINDIDYRYDLINSIIRVDKIYNDLMTVKDFRLLISGKNRVAIKAALLFFYMYYNNNKLTQNVICILYNLSSVTVGNRIKLISRSRFSNREVYIMDKEVLGE